MAGVFLIFYKSLPGSTSFIKGISYAFIIWFFRVVMYITSQWIMFKVPVVNILYLLLTGFSETLILGILYGLTLKPL
ncbi:MAG TPA: hypothetical protein PLD75_08115 [Spirochaetota bacterium]|nr:hypothetical protein [Spirochaetota bacterium]